MKFPKADTLTWQILRLVKLRFNGQTILCQRFASPHQTNGTQLVLTRCIIAHFCRMVVLRQKYYYIISSVTVPLNTFAFKIDTFAQSLKTVDNLFLYCYNVEKFIERQVDKMTNRNYEVMQYCLNRGVVLSAFIS